MNDVTPFPYTTSDQTSTSCTHVIIYSPQSSTATPPQETVDENALTATHFFATLSTFPGAPPLISMRQPFAVGNTAFFSRLSWIGTGRAVLPVEGSKERGSILLLGSRGKSNASLGVSSTSPPKRMQIHADAIADTGSPREPGCRSNVPVWGCVRGREFTQWWVRDIGASGTLAFGAFVVSGAGLMQRPPWTARTGCCLCSSALTCLGPRLCLSLDGKTTQTYLNGSYILHLQRKVHIVQDVLMPRASKVDSYTWELDKWANIEYEQFINNVRQTKRGLTKVAISTILMAATHFPDIQEIV
ncbi:hypothetical protein BU15DRAFT_59943 [Melanogaster broomeanus]|nr:hypothetical protein BU15DRAFT_59943 [Melanogaster broomeanus]